MMYTDINKFITKLTSLISLSISENILTEEQEKELLMLKLLEVFCKENNLIYSRNKTNGNVIDGTINAFTFQGKFVSLNYKNEVVYSINSKKTAGRLKEKHIQKPYEIGDFDFIIIELGGTIEDPNKYKENFCIIPFSILMEQKIIKYTDNKGKQTFSVCPPDYSRDHWSKIYWNNIHPLKI